MRFLFLLLLRASGFLFGGSIYLLGLFLWYHNVILAVLFGIATATSFLACLIDAGRPSQEIDIHAVVPFTPREITTMRLNDVDFIKNPDGTWSAVS